MNTKTGQETVAPGSISRESKEHAGDMCNNIDGELKKVSIKAVQSVAGQYGISASIFKEWLEGNGFQILEEA
jgi:hypothetical protein